MGASSRNGTMKNTCAPKVEIRISAKLLSETRSFAAEKGVSFNAHLAGVMYERANAARQESARLLSFADSWDEAAKTIATAVEPFDVNVVNAESTGADDGLTVTDEAFVISILNRSI